MASSGSTATSRVIIAIDFGTSRSGYAYAFTSKEQVQGRKQWPGQPYDYPKTLTEILYSPEKKLVAWGFEARQKLAALPREEAKRHSFVSEFKMFLSKGHQLGKLPLCIASDGREFPVYDVIADYLREMKKLALEEIRGQVGAHLLENEILWCLTVPAIWTDRDKDAMRHAAQHSGLIGASDEEEERLLIVLEPEAAALYCQQQQHIELKPGDRFMVVDCGGGTIDITAHQVLQNGGLNEVATGSGGACGSTYIDREFRRFLVKKIGRHALGKLRRTSPRDYLKLVTDWEGVKHNLGNEQKQRGVFVPFPNSLYKILERDFPREFEQLSEEQDGETGGLELNSADLDSIFNPVLDQVIAKVKEQLDRSGKCDYMFLAGGFSTSLLLRLRIDKAFSSRVGRIVMPINPGAAIVEGAVLFGLDPLRIRARRSRYTYGCDSTRAFQEGIDPEEKRHWYEDLGRDQCENVFSIFVRAGDLVPVGEKVVRSYRPTAFYQSAMRFDLLATRRKDVRFTDDTTIEKLGVFEIDLPDVGDDLDRPVKLTMEFGRTEIKVEAVDVETGERARTSLRFTALTDSARGTMSDD